MPETNTLAYYEHSQITDVQRLISLGPSGTLLKTFLSLSKIVGKNNLECFIARKLSQDTLIFDSKARAYPSGEVLVKLT